MDPRTLATVLSRRRTLRSHDRWSRRELEVYQAGALRDLRDHAVARSPFYGALHRGLDQRPLHELPIVTKPELMAAFDDVVTDRALHLDDVRAYLETVSPERNNPPLHDKWYVTSTSGSTGARGIFVQDRDEWLWVLTSYARANDWAGLRAGLTHRMKLAVVSSRTPWHQSALVGATLQSRFVPTLRIDATEPVASIDEKLNDFQPESLVGYASMMRLLAEEQLAGRLCIAPKAVTCSSEVITEDTRQRIARAFGRPPVEVYAATEPAGIASHCDRGRMHLYEDLVIAEVVDEHDRPIPPGVYGARVLVTVLFSRTMPLIRYAMSDSVRLSPESCDCGRPYALIDGIQGRREDVLMFDGVAVQPNSFHKTMELLPVAAWQIEQQHDGLVVRLVGRDAHKSLADVQRGVTAVLAGQGVRANVRVEDVASIAKTKMGKAPLIVAAQRLTL
jgi:phenylacetate-CoA ligase